jgi:hypothetical protein
LGISKKFTEKLRRYISLLSMDSKNYATKGKYNDLLQQVCRHDELSPEKIELLLTELRAH